MMPNALTRHVGLNAGTWVLETLLKHYFENLFKDKASRAAAIEPNPASVSSSSSGELRRDELLYDEAFNIIKSFLDAATHHTVEELQEFSNARTPSPPWTHVMRVLVPMSCCDEAAGYLIEALGGEEKTREVVGGTKWWQVRGLKGVDAQWIVARKDYQYAIKRKRQAERAEKERKENSDEDDEDVYSPEMDELRCILYFHGGGYYFGSVDQERYFMQRFARKTGCRLLAINYRLAPQYPFPCAIQDALATYLYLIRPPPSAPHTPVNPAHILVSGDSAGGGLTLALLQVLRDASLPTPAGAAPISPWCDLTHSFPSIHTNTETDIIPKYGLSVYKPSPLWPPPSAEVTNIVHTGLRSRVKSAVRQYYETNTDRDSKHDQKREQERSRRFWTRKSSFGQEKQPTSPPTSPKSPLAECAKTGDVREAALSHNQEDEHTGDFMTDGVLTGSTAPVPVDNGRDETLRVVTESGEVLEVHDQVHMYAPNSLLVHPLISPALSYLGGLPPLLIIASDSEVLRDEIIYTAHKAAHPEKYPVKPEARKLYPKLEGIEEQYGPTKVHLQVYDQTAHVLPVLFSFCTPAKYCFRALATFGKYALGTLNSPKKGNDSGKEPTAPMKRSMSFKVTRRLSFMGNSRSPPKLTKRRTSSYSSNTRTRDEVTLQIKGDTSYADNPSEASSPANKRDDGMRHMYAGEPGVYQVEGSPFKDNMIRERVSIRGEIRPLEPESELVACNMPDERIGALSELILRRYLEGSTKWNERYARKKKEISKSRARSLSRASKKDSVRNMALLQMHFYPGPMNAHGLETDKRGPKVPLLRRTPGIKEGLGQATASWAWAWALDGLENPPPSSIVARRDTEEARRLGKIADQPVDGHDHKMSANNLWSFLINKLNLEKEKAGLEESAVAEYNPQLNSSGGETVANKASSGPISDPEPNSSNNNEGNMIEGNRSNVNDKQITNVIPPETEKSEEAENPISLLEPSQSPESTTKTAASLSEVGTQKGFRTLSTSRKQSMQSNDGGTDKDEGMGRRGLRRLVSASSAIISRTQSPSRTLTSHNKSGAQSERPMDDTGNNNTNATKVGIFGRVKSN